ncbi:MAG: transporter substrate-binding domain-containing protein, partial [Sneathiella sp.]
MRGVYWKTNLGLFLFSLIACLLALQAARAADQKITFYTVDFPPYEFENPDSAGLRGFDIEVVIEAFKRMDIDADVDFLPWKRVIASSKAGTIAGAVSCVYTKEREAFYRFSAPISYSTQTFAYTPEYEGPVLKNIKDAEGLRILVVEG